MQTIGGLSFFPYALALVVLGATASPLWLSAVGAFVGVGLSYMAVPNVGRSFARERNSIGGMLVLLVGLYAMQLIFAAILYGVGRAIGAFL